MSKIKVGILGATGTVGQRFIQLLENHPWFEIAALGASEKSQGKTYEAAVNWKLSTPIPEAIIPLILEECNPNPAGNLSKCQLVFSALDANIAGTVEEEFAKAGIHVISNAKNNRMSPDVPMIVPLVNGAHLDMLEHQLKSRGPGRGFIVTNCNCSTAGLVVPLKALDDAFGVEQVFVVTMQAISGAGYPGMHMNSKIVFVTSGSCTTKFIQLFEIICGVASLDILDNVVPYISGEEEKMEIEPLKILGKIITDDSTHEKQFKFADVNISAQCNRVHVLDGHTESVSVKLRSKAPIDQVLQVLREFNSEAEQLKLPSAPKRPIVVMNQIDRPQPRLDRHVGNGYSVTVGRVRACPLLDVKFTVLSHNTVLGAAGGAILAAELCKAKNYL